MTDVVGNVDFDNVHENNDFDVIEMFDRDVEKGVIVKNYGGGEEL